MRLAPPTKVWFLCSSRPVFDQEAGLAVLICNMVVWHSHDPVGIASFVAVLILLLFGDVVCVYFVIEYGNYGG